MKIKDKNPEISTWAEIKDSVYGKRGSEWRDTLERESESFSIGLKLRTARESQNMTQDALGKIVDKNRAYISRIENDGSNITLKTLFEIVEKGLGGEVKISNEI